MLSLGGSVIGFSSADSSSASKGESVADTIRTVSCYADICVIRHPKEGAALVASQFSQIPVINAGDGGHEHPTQTYTDLLTIHAIKGKISGLTVGCCGDLKFGRTVHSLIKALSLYPGNKFILVSPSELQAPDYILALLKERGCQYEEHESLENCIKDMDVLYMTRVQRERFFNEEDYIRLKDSYILNSKKLSTAKPDLALLHPLPRVNEIAFEVDNDPRAHYFRQVHYGKLVRMALITALLKLQAGGNYA
jgi:aspartate carbamoyltransferase catalytic subunit